jgi:hypothetical protein
MKNSILVATIFMFTFLSCKDNYKTQSSQVDTESSDNNVVLTEPVSQVKANEAALHTVIVNEIIPTSNYTYLKVTEKEKQFWIGVNKADAKVGETYYYVGGDLKTNFTSKALDKVFDELYLVGNLVSANHGNMSEMTGSNSTEIEKIETKTVHTQGSIKIADLVNNPKQYEGQKVQIDGVCTKINLGIMSRNWIHLKDGSKDDYDLVVTSSEEVAIGSKVTIKADVVLNKDFGAGYKYELILENGILVK